MSVHTTTDIAAALAEVTRAAGALDAAFTANSRGGWTNVTALVTALGAAKDKAEQIGASPAQIQIAIGAGIPE